MSATALLKPFLEEWDGPLPRGFLAVAAAKGITVQQQTFSLAAHTLQAMRRDLRHTSLAKALQARPTIQSSNYLLVDARIPWSTTVKSSRNRRRHLLLP